MVNTDVLRWSQKYPELGTEPLPIEPYISQDFYAREKDKVFKKAWLMVARVEEVARPGDSKVKKIAAADTSVIVMHGKDGKIRAFHNMCSHRGNTVVSEAGEETYRRSRAGVLTCRFHGWVYSAEGALVQVPQEEKFFGSFCKAENGLTPVACDVWEGFVFVNFDKAPETSLAEYLGAYADHFAGYPYGELTHNFVYHTYLNCNWKVAHDAFAEAYHVDTIHAGSFPNAFSTGLQNVKLMGPHRTCAVCLTMKADPSPVAGLAQKLARGSLVGATTKSMLPATINPDNRADFAFELSVIFPNTLLHVAEGIWFTHQFWPIAHDKTLWEGKYYVRQPTKYSELWALEHAMNLQRNAWLEDTATMEDTHRAMVSGAKTHQHAQDEEVLIRHGQKVLEKFMTQ